MSKNPGKKKQLKAESKHWAHDLVKDVWPQERDFLERPERFRYVRKLLPEKGCVFCNAVKKGVREDSLVLYQDKDIAVLMNKYPYNTGHLLIVPTTHEGEIWKLDEEINAAMAKWIRRSSKILMKEMGCHGLNMGMNHGKVAGAGIPDHLHWHVIPRWGGDTNFFPLIAETKALPETLQQTYQRLAPHFKSNKAKRAAK